MSWLWQEFLRRFPTGKAHFPRRSVGTGKFRCARSYAETLRRNITPKHYGRTVFRPPSLFGDLSPRSSRFNRGVIFICWWSATWWSIAVCPEQSCQPLIPLDQVVATANPNTAHHSPLDPTLLGNASTPSPSDSSFPSDSQGTSHSKALWLFHCIQFRPWRRYGHTPVPIHNPKLMRVHPLAQPRAFAPTNSRATIPMVIQGYHQI